MSSGYNESIELNELITNQKDELKKIQKETDIAQDQANSAIEKLNEIKNDYDESIELEKLIEVQNKKLDTINSDIKNTEKQKNELVSDINKLKEAYIELEDEILLQSYGFFEPKYNLEDSEAYKIKLVEIKQKQKNMVRNKDAAHYNPNWTVNGSKAEGKKMNNNLIKQALRSFNSECDIAISKVTVANHHSMEKRILNIFDAVNKMNQTNSISLKVEYLQLKLEELYLALEYAQKIEKEKEEQRQIKEQMREEEKVRREIEKEKEKVEKEEKHFAKALEKLETQKEKATSEQLEEIEAKISELKTKLSEVQLQKEDVLNRERNTRAGYVYIISNIGSFGENVYKIGMTRRLEPLDRVRELGSASVPFKFDVHAMIFSDDAPSLEATLHRTFQSKRLNLVNERKEFFNVTLEEIRAVIDKHHDKTVEFKTTALAEEYRETLSLRERVSENKIA